MREQGAKLLFFWISGTPKNDNGNPTFRPGIPSGNPEKDGHFTIGATVFRNPKSARETQFKGVDFQKETQISFSFCFTPFI